jgi:hypothetical protein
MLIPFSLQAQECKVTLDEFNSCIKKNTEEICSRKIISDYSVNLYLKLNYTLRGAISDNNCKTLAVKLKDELLRLPVSSGVVYRGINNTPPVLKKIAEDYHEGACYTDFGFLSTSIDLNTAKAFAGSNGALLYIATQSGRDITKFSQISAEHEVLIPPHTWFKLTTKPYKSANYTTFDLKEVPESECDQKMFPIPGPPSSILVADATYGGNLVQIEKGNAKEAVVKFCQGKSTCTYQISKKHLTDPAPKLDKSFSVTWSCQTEEHVTGPFTATLPPSAADALFSFGCSKTGKEFLKITELNAQDVKIHLISALTSTQKDVTDIIQKKMISPTALFTVLLSSTDLPQTSGLTVTYQCETKEGKILKEAMLKRDEEGNFMGDLNCLK